MLLKTSSYEITVFLSVSVSVFPIQHLVNPIRPHYQPCIPIETCSLVGIHVPYRNYTLSAVVCCVINAIKYCVGGLIYGLCVWEFVPEIL